MRDSSRHYNARTTVINRVTPFSILREYTSFAANSYNVCKMIQVIIASWKIMNYLPSVRKKIAIEYRILRHLATNMCFQGFVPWCTFVLFSRRFTWTFCTSYMDSLFGNTCWRLFCNGLLLLLRLQLVQLLPPLLVQLVLLLPVDTGCIEGFCYHYYLYMVWSFILLVQLHHYLPSIILASSGSTNTTTMTFVWYRADYLYEKYYVYVEK